MGGLSGPQASSGNVVKPLSAVPPHFARSLWNGLQSYLMVCLVICSLFFTVAAFLGGRVSVIAGIIGLWIVLLDWAPTPGIMKRTSGTLAASSNGVQETDADRLPVLLRIGGAALVLWAVAVGHG